MKHAIIITAAALVSLLPAGAAAGNRARQLDELWKAIMAKLDRASAARDPAPVPPKPVAVTWQPRRISSIGLDAPLLAMEAADVSGDGRAELIALTTGELLIIERTSRRTLQIMARAPLPDEFASIRPRDPVGTLVITRARETAAGDDGGGGNETAQARVTIWARSAEQARGAAFAYQRGGLVEIERFAGFPVCSGVFAELAPGRNYFASATSAAPGGTPPLAAPSSSPAQAAPPASPPPWTIALTDPAQPFYAASCRDGLVDPSGHALVVEGRVSVDSLLLLRSHRRCRYRDPSCEASASPAEARQWLSADTQVKDTGFAFAVADIDRDGHPEILHSAAVPPGQADRILVHTWQGGKLKPRLARDVSGGVVALASGDLDGDGDEDAIAAVRIAGSHRVDIWTLSQ